jgi:hypothetical protein
MVLQWAAFPEFLQVFSSLPHPNLAVRQGKGVRQRWQNTQKPDFPDNEVAGSSIL